LGKLCITISAIQPERITQYISTQELFWGPLWPGLVAMKNIYEVLRNKEMDLVRLRTEVDALRLVAPLLSDSSAEPGNAEPMLQLDAAWTPALQKNKWPITVDHPAPTYSDS